MPAERGFCMQYLYPAIFHRAEEGGYWVEFPDLPGCLTQGDTLKEAIAMATDAASGWIFTSLRDGETPPFASSTSDIEIEPDDIINLILIDMDVYSKTHSSKAVKKTLTIPAWLNDIAENQNVNFSQTLQKALIHELGIESDAV